MNTAILSGIPSAHGPAARSARACLVATLWLAAGAVVAGEVPEWASATASLSPLPLTAAPGTIATSPVIEISASNLPRFDNTDGNNRTRQRVDMALLSSGRSAFGVTMGVTGLSPSRYGVGAASADGLTGANLGLQWRYMLENNRRIDITAWREVGRANDALTLAQSRDAGYGARVEMQLAGSRTPFVADRGFVGLQLDGGARITLRRSAGKPMVYYRSRF